MITKVEVIREKCKETFRVCLEEMADEDWKVKYYSILLVDNNVEYFAILERKEFGS